MAFTIEVKPINIAGMENLRKQVPFATALALTRTAQAAQSDVRRQLSSRFTIRNNFVSQGIRIKPATKADLEAWVFDRDDFMVLQETGGIKTPQGRSLAIPEDARTNKRGIVSRSNRPRALLGRPGVFRARIGGLDGLWQRLTGHKGKRRRGEKTLKLLFVFKPMVPIKARFGFEDTVRKVVKGLFSLEFRQAFLQAISTAKR